MKKFLLSLFAILGVLNAQAAWEKTTSISVGDVVVLAFDNSTVAKELSGVTTIGTVDDYTDAPEGVYPLTVVEGSQDGTFAFKTTANTYLAWSSGNSLTTAEEVADASSWTVTFTEAGAADIYNVGTTARKLQYNTGSPRFACYGNSSQQAPYFWKQVADDGIAKPVLPASTSFMGSMEVAITAAEGTTIYYTLDGTDPTSESTVYSEALTITETTTVKAIAVVATGASSGVASATYTKLASYATVAELTALENNATFAFTGEALIVAKPTAKHVYISDQSGVSLIFDTSGNKTAAAEVGKTIAANWTGKVSIYNKLFELVPDQAIVVKDGDAVSVTYPTVTPSDINADNVNKVVTLKGITSYSVSGKNITISVGDANVVGFNQFGLEIAAAEESKTYEMVGAISRYNDNIQFQPITIAEAQPFDSSIAIENADFSAGTIIDNHICTYAKDMEGNGTTFSQMQEVAGWTIVSNGDARAAGVMAYGSDTWIGGAGYAVPAFNPAGLVEGQGLGIVAVWSADAQYTQAISYKPGYYLVSARINNVGGTTATATNFFGARVGETNHFAENKAYAVGTWTRENVTFQVEETAEGVISLGYKATNAGNAAQQHLFYDGVIVKVFETEEARTAFIEDQATADATDAAAYALAVARKNKVAELEALPRGDKLFQYSDAAVLDALAALLAANTVEAIAAVKPAQNLPDTDKLYSFQLKDGGNYMTIDGGIKLAAEAKGFSFVPDNGGGYAIKNGESYVACTGTGNNNWSMGATVEPYSWTIAALADGYYTIAKASAPNELIGVDNTGAGSSCYADKAVSDKALWTIAEYTEPQPQTDYTSYIVNADLTGEGGFDATGTKGIDGSGIVKVGNAAAFDFKQTIENLPAGKYKVTAQAAYRYGGDEAAEYEAMQTENTITKFVQLYATVGTKTVAQLVQNRYDGASETDLAGSGAVQVNNLYVPNSSNAVKAWFAAGKYVNEVEFNLPADGAVTIGIKRVGTPESDYTVIGPWTLTRIGDAEVEPEPETLQPGDDATSFITNPSFETGDLTGWTVGSSDDTGVKPNSDATYATAGCDGNYLFNTWWQGIPITQTVTGLPNGKYELKALVANDAGEGNNDKPCIYLLANGEHAGPVQRTSKTTFAEGSMQFYVTDGTATIGVIGGNTDGSYNEAGYYWYKVDNFRLTYLAALPDISEIEIPEGKMSNAASEAIANAQQAQDVLALIEAVKAAEASIEAYAAAAEAIAAAKAIKDGTNVATTDAATTFAAAIEAIETPYNEGSLSDADAKAAGATLGTVITDWRAGADGAAVKFMESAYGLNGFDGALYINTWSKEGESDGSEFKVPFYEYFVDNNQTLAANSFTTSVEGLTPGIYDVTALIRVQPTNGQETPNGVTFSANDGEAVDATAEAIPFGDRLFLKEVATQATVSEDGKLVININVEEGNNAHWLSFKNVKYAYSDDNPQMAKAFTATTARGVWMYDAENNRIHYNDNGLPEEITDNYKFALIEKDGEQFLYSLGAKKFVQPQKYLVEGVSTPVVTVPVAGEEGKVQFKAANSTLTINIGGNQWTWDTWTSADDGNKVTIAEVEEFDPAEALAMLEKTPIDQHKVFTITTSRGQWAASADGTALSSVAKNPDATDADKQFAFYYEGSKLYIYSVGAQKFLKSDGSLFAGKGDPVDYRIVATAGKDHCFFFTDGALYFNMQPAGTYSINTWNTPDDGNKQELAAVESVDVYEEMKEVFETMLVPVTYEVVYNGQVIASEVVEHIAGDEVKIPASLDRGLCTLSADTETITATTEKVTVTATWNDLFEFSEDLENAKWYTMTIRSSWQVFKAEEEPYKPKQNATDDELASSEYQWAFGGDPFNLVIYNKATGATQSLTPANGNAVMRDGAYKWELFGNNDGFVIREARTANNWVNQSGGGGGPLSFWNSAGGKTDDGSTFRVVAVEEPVLAQEYVGIIEQTVYTPDGEPVENGTATSEQTVTITPIEDGKVNITFSGFTMPMPPFPIPEFTAEATATTNEDSSISYAAEGFQISVQQGQMTINYTGTLEGVQASADATPVLKLTIKQATTDVVYFGADQDAIDAYKASETPRVKVFTINVERYVGMGYTPTIANAADALAAAKEHLGVDELSTSALDIVKPDMVVEFDWSSYDGWFNTQGYPETWSDLNAEAEAADKSGICVKFFEAIPDGEFSIYDMNGADVVGQSYKVTWELQDNGKAAWFEINVTFVEAPEVEIEISENVIQTSVTYGNAEASYIEKSIALTEEQVAAICTELEIESLDAAVVYGYNPTTQELIANYAGFDGWRNADGDFQSWTGNATVPACVKYTDGQTYLCYNISGIEPQTIKCYWAIATETKAVLVEISFIYVEGDGINGINADLENATIYDLGGRKIQKVQRGGVYIINGKKVAIK